MTTRRLPLPLAATAAAMLALTLAACGGGSGEAPPASPGSSVSPEAPVVTITNNVVAEVATGDITFTFSFNRDVGTSFTADDVAVTGGTKGAFNRLSGTRATLVVTPTPDTTGTVVLTVAAAGVTDAVGTGNAATTAQKAYNTVAPVLRTALVSFEESPAPTLIGFGGAEDATVVVDPTNPTNKVARIVKSASAELWAGTTVAVCSSDAIARIPFSATLTKLSARVWSPVAGIPVRLKVENAANPAQSVETEAMVTVASGWQTLTFDFATPAAGTAALNTAFTYNKASVFFNFGTTGAATGARTYYLDDLSFVGSSFTASCGGAASSNVTITMDEATAPTFAGFGGAEDASIVADPAGGSNKVARVVKSAAAELWAGTTVSTLPGNQIAPIGFSATAKTITVRVWSPAAGVPVRLKVENAADPTKSVETEATVTAANTWQTLTFNFASPAAGTAALDLAATYNRASIFFNFGTPGSVTGARTYYFEDLSYPAVAAAGGGAGGATTTAINFEGTAPTFAGFGGAEDATVVVDPTNTANKVAKIVKSATAESWAGTTISTLGGNTIERIAFASGSTTITARVWSPVAGIPVRMKVENAADAAKSVETEATVTTASGWQTLSFNFATQAAGTAALDLAATYNRLSVFFDFGTTGATVGAARTYYIDDIVYPVSATVGGSVGGTLSGGIFSSDYSGNLGANTAVSDKGGSVGFFLDPRLFANKAFDDGSVCGSACNPGGVPNFYYGIGKLLPALTDAYFGGFVNAPGNGSADASPYSKIKLKFWGDAESWEKPNFTAQVDVIVQGPTNPACTNPSGRPELIKAVTAQKIGAGSEYVIPKTDFVLTENCGGAYTVNSVWSAIGAVVVRLAGTNLQYVNSVASTPVSYPTFINIGPISFIN